MLTRSRIKQVLRWSSVLVPVAVLAGIWWTGSPSRQVTISRETTYFTEPVLPNGQIDYVTAVETHLAGDIAAEDNAVALMMTVYPVPSAPAENLKQFYAALGIEQPNRSPENWTNWYKMAAIQYASPDEVVVLDRTEIDELLVSACSRPWIQAEHPQVHELVLNSNLTLSTLLEAVERPSAWQPVLTGDRRSLILSLLVVTDNARNSSKQFAVASMHHLGNGETDLAWRYCLGGHRLARHLAMLGTAMDYHTGCEIEARARETTTTFLEYASNDDMTKWLDELTQLGPFPDCSKAYDVAERCAVLEACQSICYGEPLGENLEGHGATAYLINSRVDWDEVFKEVNSLFDRAVAAFREPDYFASVALLDGLVQELDRHHRELETLPEWAVSEEQMQRKMMGLVATMFPAVYEPRLHEAIACQAAELLQVALAWKAYRHEKGQPPSELAELVPEYLPHVPLDRFANETVRLMETSGIVYSVGPDGIDDGGLPYDADSQTGDLTITLSTRQKQSH